MAEVKVRSISRSERVASAQQPPHRCSIVACARWEADRIVEWLLYYASIGFDHVYLYCNDDDPAELHAKVLPFTVGRQPYVTFLHYPFQGQQRLMYQHFLQNFVHESSFISFFDVDEYLYLPRDKTINAYLARVGKDIDVHYFNWLMFGNSGHLERSTTGVLESYTFHQSSLHAYTKLVVRTAVIDVAAVIGSPVPFWHHWPNPNHDLRQRNVLGEDMDSYYDGFPDRAFAHVRQPGFLERMLAEGLICHFALQSEADFERRLARGTAGEFAGQSDWADRKREGQHVGILQEFSAVSFDGLRDHWRAMTGAAAVPSVLGTGRRPNLALGRPALQSSIAEWSLGKSPQQDAAGATSGRWTGDFQFHTAEEPDPWWQVDLEGMHAIGEVRLYNRLGPTSIRARNLVVSLSPDGNAWTVIYRKTDAVDFGGIDGYPLRLEIAPAILGRFVRVTIPGVNYLHLDQVEVFGPPD